MKGIVITGAGKGIGFELVQQLAENSENRIIAISRNTAALQKLNLPNVTVVNFNLQKVNEYNALFSQITTELKTVDVLINNAGLLINKPFGDFIPDDFTNIYTTNVLAPLLLIQLLRPLMITGTHIVNIGSMGGINNTSKFPGMSLYSSSKAAVAVLTECLAVELKESGISINCLALGAAQTEMVSLAFPGYQAPVSAGQMASFITWFALNAAKTFNGQVIPVAMTSP